jgi:hypothetical protein
MITQIELETPEEHHEKFLYSLWQGGVINEFELEAERQKHGLSTVHIRRKDYLSNIQKQKQLARSLMSRKHYHRKKGRIEICVNGNLAKCQLPITRPVNKRRGAMRSFIRGFSRKSRLRMMRMVSKLETSKKPLFFTLTYPDEFINNLDGHEIKERHLKNFWKRLEYSYPSLSCIWKLEYVKRKSGKHIDELYPHLHMLVWGLYDVDIEDIRELVASAWWEVCGKLSNDHRLAGTRVERLRSHRGTMFYISKYMGKEETGDLAVGRWWGVKGRMHLPLAKVVVIDFLNKEDYKKVIDFMAFYAGLSEGDWKKLEVFIDGRKFLQALERIVYQGS